MFIHARKTRSLLEGADLSEGDHARVRSSSTARSEAARGIEPFTTKRISRAASETQSRTCGPHGSEESATRYSCDRDRCLRHPDPYCSQGRCLRAAVSARGYSY